MTDKLELKSSHEVIYTVDVADVESIFYCKPTDPDILTVLMKDGKRLYCDEVCPVDSLQEKPNAKFKVGQTITDPTDSTFTFHINKIEDGRYIEKEDEWVLVKEADANYKLVEEPISEELNEAAIDYAESVDYRGFSNAPWNFVQDVFKAGAMWQITKLMKDATEVTVHIDAGGYPYTPEIELYDYDKDVPLAKEGDKYKVVLIKED